MARNGWCRATRQTRCPVCDGPDNCSISDGGGFVWCGRVEQGSVRQNAGGQFLHILQSENQSRDYEHPSHRRNRKEKENRDFSPYPKTDWTELMKAATDRPDITEKRDELANQFGVSRESLDRLKVGWNDKNSAWLIPERDAAGNVIGVVRRYRNGKKRQWPGGRRGLTLANDWQSDPGPVLLVEGASDTATLLSAGICAIGRPSNCGGVALLVELLYCLPPDRRIVVVGENDRKQHDELKPSVRSRHSQECEACSLCWPGHFGAFSTAQQVSEKLQRPVEVMFPPPDSKDVREMASQISGTEILNSLCLHSQE